MLGHCLLEQFMLRHCLLDHFMLGHCLLEQFMLGHCLLEQFMLGHCLLEQFMLGHCLLEQFMLGHCLPGTCMMGPPTQGSKSLYCDCIYYPQFCTPSVIIKESKTLIVFNNCPVAINGSLVLVNVDAIIYIHVHNTFL